jgi:mRNA interferase MazF
VSLRRGDIHWIEFPASSAREQSGRRPAVIVHADDSPPLPTVFVVPLTSNIRANRYPGTLEIDPSTSNCLTERSVILAFQLRAIDRNRVGERVGCLDPSVLAVLEHHLRSLLSL